MTESRSPIDGFEGLFSARLLVVTGKGGVGKTTAAAALALAASASGRRTLLVEAEGRQGLSRLFRTQPWDYEEREFRPDVFGIAIDPEESMYEYLDRFYGLRRVSWVMSRTNALEFVTAAAPGLGDLLVIGKVYEVEHRRRSDGRPAYDTIILDAPPTGRIVPFLRSPDAATEIVRVGPIKRQAGQVTEMLEDPARTRIVLVTLLEEMPVQETAEAVRDLTSEGIAVGPIIANQALAPRFDDETRSALDGLDEEALRRAMGATLELDDEAVRLMRQQIDAHLVRVELQERMRARLREDTQVPTFDLPIIFDATFDPTVLERLADEIAVAVGERGPRAASA